jgi:hypothetical protein
MTLVGLPAVVGVIHGLRCRRLRPRLPGVEMKVLFSVAGVDRFKRRLTFSANYDLV